MTQLEKADAYSKALEKAKRYDKAFIKSREFLTLCEKCGAKDTVEFIEDIFPELKMNKEIENEKIRKDLIEMLRNWASAHYITKEQFNERMTWLEKQAEPIEINPTEFDTRLQALIGKFSSLPKEELIGSLRFWMNAIDNDEEKQNGQEEPQVYGTKDGEVITYSENDGYKVVEPKFKVGDWCIDNEDGTIFQIVKVLDNTYKYRTNEGKEYSCTRYSLELDARPWTISDVKEGDMLYDGNAACIFRKTMEDDDDDICIDTYCGINIDNEFKVNDEDEYWCLSENCSPATKEQCDTLMKAMADAGYTFDFEKKVLKNIDKKPEETSISLKDFQEAFELKARQYDIEHPNRGYDIHAMCKELYSMLTEQKPTWSQEDKHWMQKVIDFMNHPDLIKATPTLAKDTINWLKSLKDRVQPQSKQEWNEEDESNFQGIIDVIKENKHHTTDYEHMIYYKLLSWFKSLKDRYAWKPSDEQIDALEHFVRSIGESGFASPYDDNTRLLYSLLEQLKKL